MTGRQWTLIHNGILFNEGLTFPYEDRTEGETDSERMAAFLTDVMDEAYLRGAKVTFHVRFGALTGAVTQLANRNRVNERRASILQLRKLVPFARDLGVKYELRVLSHLVSLELAASSSEVALSRAVWTECAENVKRMVGEAFVVNS